MTFQFRLQAVLKVRQHERTVQQQSVSIARRFHQDRVAERESLANERSNVMDELRSMNEGTGWSLDQVIDRQRHVDQLGLALARADAAVKHAAIQLDACLKQLILADQSVRSLEKLSERQFTEFELQKGKQIAIEFDDASRIDRRVA